MKKQSSWSTPSKKRAYSPVSYDDYEFDAENIDPSTFSPKRAKALDGTPKKTTISLSTSAMSSTALKSLLTPQKTKLSYTPVSAPVAQPSKSVSAPYVPPFGMNTRPAGRSPQTKRSGLLGRKSRVSRIDPPAFGSSSGAIPFTIDEAIANTVSPSSVPKPKKATRGQAFVLWEDTPDVEAQNLMEHCAGIMDISSDDEAGPAKKLDRGKENVAPADYVVPNPVTLGQAKGVLKARRSAHVDAMTDVGEERAPLGALSARNFYGTGLNDKSIVIVHTDAENTLESVPETPAAEDDAVNVHFLLAGIKAPSAPATAGFTIVCDEDDNEL